MQLVNVLLYAELVSISAVHAISHCTGVSPDSTAGEQRHHEVRGQLHQQGGPEMPHRRLHLHL